MIAHDEHLCLAHHWYIIRRERPTGVGPQAKNKMKTNCRRLPSHPRVGIPLTDSPTHTHTHTRSSRVKPFVPALLACLSVTLQMSQDAAWVLRRRKRTSVMNTEPKRKRAHTEREGAPESVCVCVSMCVRACVRQAESRSMGQYVYWFSGSPGSWHSADVFFQLGRKPARKLLVKKFARKIV